MTTRHRRPQVGTVGATGVGGAIVTLAVAFFPDLDPQQAAALAVFAGMVSGWVRKAHKKRNKKKAAA